MRYILPVLVLALFPATAAFGQSVDNEALIQQRIDQQRAVALENRLNTLEAQAQTERRIGDLNAQRTQPGVLPRDEKLPLPVGNPAGFAEIPDAALAASNERVRQASQIRR